MKHHRTFSWHQWVFHILDGKEKVTEKRRKGDYEAFVSIIAMNIFIKMRHLWSTDVSLIRLGEDGDEHCEGSVVVKDSQNQPDPESWWWKPRQMSNFKCREFIFKMIIQSSYHGDLLRMTSLCEWENTTTAPRREETTSRISDRSRPHLNTFF